MRDWSEKIIQEDRLRFWQSGEGKRRTTRKRVVVSSPDITSNKNSALQSRAQRIAAYHASREAAAKNLPAQAEPAAGESPLIMGKGGLIEEDSFQSQNLGVWVLARQALDLVGVADEGVDEEMVAAILLILLQPGSRKQVFHAQYHPLGYIEGRAVHHYQVRLRLRYRRKALYETLEWLVGQGILMTKSKPDSLMYSLVSQVNKGESALAKDIIRNILELASAKKLVC